MEIKMTLEQALGFVENYTKDSTFHENSWCAKTAMVVIAEELKKLQPKHECAMKTLRQIADRKRKTQERNLANACVVFLDSMSSNVLS